MHDPERQNQSSITEGTEIQTAGLFRELIEALSGVIPVLDKIKWTIEESTGKIPNASRQLNNVTKATESATVEILNVLDIMTRNIDQADQGLDVLAGTHQRHRETLGKILALLDGCTEPAARDAAGLVRERAEDEARILDASGTLADVRASLTCAKERSMDIAMALQVQDITAQQIAGVAHMIESVRVQLARLFAQINEVGGDPSAGAAGSSRGSAAEAQKSFDTNAQYVPSGDRQGGADEIVEQWNKPRHE